MTDATHQRVWDDIPWYINGTLDEAAAAQVEAHASGCAACRAEIAAQQRIASALLETGFLEQGASANWAKIDARLGGAERGSAGLLDRLLGWLPRLKGAALPMGALASVLVALLAVGVIWQGPAVYRTLTAPAAEDTSDLRLRAVPGADHDGLLADLEAAGFVVLSEDGPGSVIRLTVPQDPAARADALSVLRSDARIALIAGQSE